MRGPARSATVPAIVNNKQTVVMVIVLLLVIGGAIAFIVHQQRAPAKLNLLAGNVPTILAEETDKLLAHHGQVVIVALATAPGGASDAGVFQKQLKQFKGLTVAGVEALPPQVLSGMPAAVYLEVLKKYHEIGRAHV